MYGEFQIDVPRDRNGEFEPNADTLNISGSISGIEETVISLYARGMSTEIIDSIQTISAISQQVSAHAGETMQAEEENLNVMQDVSAIMQKLAALAAHS